MSVAIIGAGKSGALCLAQARRNLQGNGQLLCIDVSRSSLDELSAIGLIDRAICIDATKSMTVLELVSEATNGALCDLVVNCASVSNTEMSSILCARDGGTVIFFSMATQFAASALGAEGIGKDVVLVIGNGYVPGHAELTLQLLRSNNKLKQLFETRYLRRM
jgi:L-erythro-3,5-diaminohexanoate dehydrogenase